MNNHDHTSFELPAVSAPAPLTQYNQFIVWAMEWTPGSVKPTKIPYNARTGQRASSTDVSTWCTYEEAVSAYYNGAGRYAGIGFVFTQADPFFFLDIDDCLDDATGQWKPHAVNMCNWLNASFIERSQSGRGLHLIGVCHKHEFSNRRRKWKDADGNQFECYVDGRFIAFGKCDWHGNANVDLTPILTQIIPEIEHTDVADITDEARPEYTGPDDDQQLITMMMRASDRGRPSDAFRSGAVNVTLRELWEGDASALGAAYPDQGGQGRAYDASSADAALLAHLAFWTGCNGRRMMRLFGMSALGRREKWITRGDYRGRSVKSAIGKCRAIYDVVSRDEDRRNKQLQENVEIGDEIVEPPLPVLLTLDDMLRDLVYVEGSGAIVNTANMRVRRKETAVDTYAASKTVYTPNPDDIDHLTGQPKTKTASSLKLWLERSERLSVDCVTWAPGKPLFCLPPESSDFGGRAVNIFKPLPPNSAPVDWQQRVQPFFTHLTYLIPDEAERVRFLGWCAHMLQRPDELPHTCYLMITEQTGIGRNWLASVLVRVLRGYVASGVDIGKVLDGSFNGRLARKLLAVVDETREGMSEKRYARGEALKSIITAEFREINPKYGVQTVEYNCLRWLMFSNHWDALPINNNDRRVITIQNPTERASEEYYAWIYGMLDDGWFISSVREFLQTMDISGFNAGAHAPTNAAKERAIDEMTSELDRAVKSFAADWPGPFASRSNIRLYVQQMTGVSVNENHLTHAINRAGMVSPKKRIKIMGAADSLVIVRDYSPHEIERFSPTSIADQIIDANAKFTLD